MRVIFKASFSFTRKAMKGEEEVSAFAPLLPKYFNGLQT